ncbi:MAG: filamentous hemagglutinin N-terminal domain-containing protein, partial [Ideonella sp.]
MNGHAAINRLYRLVWSDRLQGWVAAAETVRGRGKRSSGVDHALPNAAGTTAAEARLPDWRPTLVASGLMLLSAVAAAAPGSTEVPSGGQVVNGQAGIQQNGAQLQVNQTTNRAVIDWKTFNVGRDAQVRFEQPSAAAVTLNRVHDSQPSQILGQITANGQVFLVNPSGIYFGKSASVDVGGMVAGTHDINNADFMAGKASFQRNGSTGAVINEGQLRAALGGYIALLAPEVRNQGVIVARMGTVALASGERVTLKFGAANSLADIVVEPSQVKALIDNQGAVMAPGGVIILSALALDRLQGGVVRNSGTLEATGMVMKGGRIVLEASDRIENSGRINASAGADGSPAGQVSLTAPVVVNSGSIAAAALPAVSAMAVVASHGGQIKVVTREFKQASSGQLDVSGALKGGSVQVRATKAVELAGTVDASAAQGEGGQIEVAAAGDVTLVSAKLDTSGSAVGGQVRLAAGEEVVATPMQAPRNPLPYQPSVPTLALLGQSQVRSSSRRGAGGSVTLTGEHV